MSFHYFSRVLFLFLLWIASHVQQTAWPWRSLMDDNKSIESPVSVESLAVSNSNSTLYSGGWLLIILLESQRSPFFSTLRSWSLLFVLAGPQWESRHRLLGRPKLYSPPLLLLLLLPVCYSADGMRFTRFTITGRNSRGSPENSLAGTWC